MALNLESLGKITEKYMLPLWRERLGLDKDYPEDKFKILIELYNEACPPCECDHG